MSYTNTYSKRPSTRKKLLAVEGSVALKLIIATVLVSGRYTHSQAIHSCRELLEKIYLRYHNDSAGVSAPQSLNVYSAHVLIAKSIRCI